MRKGEFEYRKRYRIKTIIILWIFIALIILQIYLSKVTTGSLSKLLIVSGILTVLPMANLASPFLASLRFAPLSKEKFEKTKIYQEYMVYDLILTTKAQILGTDILYINDKRLYFYIVGRIDEDKARSYIKEVLFLHHVKREVAFFTDFSVFLKRIQKEPAPALLTEEKQQENKDIKEIFINLSI